MERVQRQVPFDLEQIDVSGDAELSKKYGDKAPVVMINGKQAFQGAVPEAAFKRRLKKAKGTTGGAEAAPVVVEAVPTSSAAKAVPMPVMATILIAMLVGCGYFLWEGFAEAAYGKGRLARKLLRVQDRNEAPLPFSLEGWDGARVTSDERFRNRVVFVNFWATWCPPCVEEMPSMLRLKAKMADDPRFEMIAISTDDGWSPVRKFFKATPPFEVLLDEEGDLARQYGTEKFPETYIVVDGRLVGHIVGPRDWDTWYAEAYLRAATEHGLQL